VYSIWLVLTALDTIIPKYCSQKHIAEWQKMWLLAAIDWKISLVGFLFITLVLVLEASCRKSQDQNKLLASTEIPIGVGTKQLALTTEELDANREPKSNIVFSYCHRDAISLGEGEELEIIGVWIAEFFNDVLNPQDRVNGVVAHLVYFSEPKPGREIGDPLWITRQGVWEPGHDCTFDFLMNDRGGHWFWRLSFPKIARRQQRFMLWAATMKTIFIRMG